MKLVIRECNNGKVLSVVETITIAPVVNSTVTTIDGIYEICEMGFDYTKGHVTAYTYNYTHDPVEEYNDKGEIIPS